MIDVQRVDYIRVPVTDMEKANHFYGELLGLERNPNSHEDWVEYETGNVTLAVMTPHTHGYEFTPLPPGTIAFRVPDVAEARAKLPAVLLALAELDGVARVRLSSIEVNHLSAGLCEVLAHPRVCPHLHVPLQSGDDGVLHAMRRRYDVATYARRVERARAAVPALNLTGDVIVGFPAEDGRDQDVIGCPLTHGTN